MPTMSSRLIQLTHCRPEPSRPPSPSWNSRLWIDREPPSRACTTPLRTWTVRMPAALAGSAAASHWRLTSVRTSSPRSPYQLTPEAQTSTRGPSPRRAIVSASSRVPFTRLPRISRLTPAVHRGAPMLLPARCTTAPAPASAPSSMVPPAGSQRAAPGPGLGERVKRMTSWPSAVSLETRAVPTRPVEPVTAMRISKEGYPAGPAHTDGSGTTARRRWFAPPPPERLHGRMRDASDPGDPWDPARYERFATERSAPFYDLLDLIRPIPAGRAVDLGCGTGALTLELHRRVRAGETLGIDSSPAMLERARPLAGGGLRFEQGDIAGLGHTGDDRHWDLVFSNAALHWVPDHPALLARLAAVLARGGQLAVQMPANFDHPSHVVAAELADEEPFRGALGGYRRVVPVESPERYAELLDGLGFAEQDVRLQVYGHRLAGPEEVVEWVRGTLLTDYQRRMPAELFERYLATYRERLLPLYEGRRPYFYPFKRLLLWAARRADPRATSAPWS